MDTIGDFREILGEGPVWCELEQALYWVDIRRHLIRRYIPESGQTDTWETPELVSCFALRKQGGLLVALRSRLAFFNPATGSTEPVAAPEVGKSDIRFNDGKCDPAGRFVVGSMNDVSRNPVGSLWSLERSSSRALLRGCRIPNGLAWSPDGSRMYFSDTLDGEVWSFDYDVTSGEIENRRTFVRIGGGGPDGATVDGDGFYWCAIYGGWRVERYAPNGRLDRTINVPVQNPTSCAFGGRNLDTLYVTTARQRLSPEALAAQPLAGAILAVDVGISIRGLPAVRFAW
jgi:sugar lactone lactonase YvrE